MIELDSVYLKYGNHMVLEDISLFIERGGIVCFYGDSGCGKTSLLRVMAGLLRPESGEVITASSRMGFAFQDDVLLEWRNLEENMLFALLSYHDRKAARDLASLWLKKTGLYEFRDKRPGQLSGGMRRRLNIARSMAVEPDILFLDEPFAFLDGGNIQLIREYSLELNRSRQTTVVMASHSLEHLKGLDYRLVNMDDL